MLFDGPGFMRARRVAFRGFLFRYAAPAPFRQEASELPTRPIKGATRTIRWWRIAKSETVEVATLPWLEVRSLSSAIAFHSNDDRQDKQQGGVNKERKLQRHEDVLRWESLGQLPATHKVYIGVLPKVSTPW